jgi:hypothetical protein
MNKDRHKKNYITEAPYICEDQQEAKEKAKLHKRRSSTKKMLENKIKYKHNNKTIN